MSRAASLLLCLIFATSFAACGGGGGGSDPQPNGGGGGGGGGGGPASGLSTRPANSECVAFALTTSNGDATVQQAFSGLTAFSGAITGLYQAPNDASHWYATFQSGQIHRFANDDAVTSSTALTGAPAVADLDEGGLLSMAFHPQFASNGYVFLSYTTGSVGSFVSHITRYTLSGTTLSSPREIITLSQPASNHNGGNIAFGPDGYLYIGFGDGGGADDEFDNGQNPQTFHAKILRIDVDSGNPYSVPAGNPFVGNSSYLPEIYAHGFRNPWRFSFDRSNGSLWAADVGQNEYEEVDRVIAGSNYGWPVTEGMHCFNYTTTCDRTGLTSPIFEYPHSEGCSITGGFVYRGSLIPSLQGHYLYSDYCAGGLNSFDTANAASTRAVSILPSVPSRPTAFGESLAGEILIGTSDGKFYRLTTTTDGGGTTSVPQTLSEHPCVADAPAQQLTDGVIPYTVNNALWSDGADKTRFIALPDGQKIDVDAHGDLTFPIGSVLIKQFSHNNQLLETRFLIHHESGWAGYSYEWNDSGTDATLSTTAHTKLLADGDEHIFPSPAQCNECHTSAAKIALGPETAQLNADYTYASTDITANQLDTWQHIGLFTANLSTTNRDRYIPAIGGEGASIEQRARAYLHSNCSGCHRPGGFPENIDLRYDTELANTGICNAVPIAGDLGISGARVLVPGNTALSLIYQRMNRRDADQMPPLASNEIDTDAVEVIGDWIEGIEGCP